MGGEKSFFLMADLGHKKTCSLKLLDISTSSALEYSLIVTEYTPGEVCTDSSFYFMDVWKLITRKKRDSQQKIFHIVN